MKRVPVVLALTATLSVPLAVTTGAVFAAVSQVGGTEPVYFGEAPSGSYLERYDDYGADATTLSSKRIALSFYGAGWPNNEEGVGTYWFHTRRGSTFYLSKCDAAGRLLPEPVKVSRTTFLRRVARTEEREVSITYDAKRNAGTFTVYSGYLGTTPQGDTDLLPCPAR